MRIVDLSFPIRPHFRWKAVPELVASHAHGHPLQSTVITLSCHAYTHVDAPLHFLPDGRPITEPRRRPSREEYTTHARFFPAGITVIEYLTNLDVIGAERCQFIALPLRIEGADGSPVRAIALVE